MRFGGLIFAIILAAVAAFIVLSTSGSSNKQIAQTPGEAPQQSITTTNVIVAAQPIVPGMLITDEMLEVQPWPEHLVVEGFAIAGNDVVSGMISRGNFQPQEPILKNKLVNKDDPNFIAGRLPKGMRMVTIQTNETDGLAGFVFPGDRVDVILTHEVEEEKFVQPPGGAKGQLSQKRETKSFTETLLTNVRVLAVDQRAAGGVNEDGTIPIPRSVSLAASPSDAQRLRLGAKIGALTLTLRSAEDAESADPITLTAFNDISQYQKPDDSITPTSEVIIVRGTQPEESTGLSAPLDLTSQIASSAIASGTSGAAQVLPAVAVRVNPGEPTAN